jgi:hypothetical protein
MRLGSLQLDRSDLQKLPAEDLIGIKKIYERALNSPAGLDLMGSPGQEAAPSFNVELSHAEGLVLSTSRGRARIASFEEILTEPAGWDLVTGKTPIIRQWEVIQRHALRLRVGQMSEMSPAQRESAAGVQRAFEGAQKEREAAAQASAPGRSGRMSEIFAVGCDGVTVLRNSAGALAVRAGTSPATAAKLAAVVTGLGISGGFLIAGCAGFMIRNGIRSIGSAYQRGDVWEGACSVGNVVLGTNLFLVGSAMTSLKIASLVNPTGSVAVHATTLFLGAGFAFYAIMGVAGAVGAAINGRFRSTFNGIVGRQEGSETEKLCEALKWLREQVSISEFEGMEISAKAKRDEKDPEAVLQRTLENKWKAFACRTSEKVAALISERVTPEMLKKLEEGDAGALQDARQIISEVSRENFNRIVANVMWIAIAVLGILGMVAMVVSSGPLSWALFALGGVCWLMLDSTFLNGQLNRICWGVRNAIWPESNFDVQKEVCPPQLTTSSFTSAQSGDLPNTRSIHTDEISAFSRHSSEEVLGTG